MRVTIRQIGNSKGVIVPASFLAETGLQDEAEIFFIGLLEQWNKTTAMRIVSILIDFARLPFSSKTKALM